LARRLHGVAGLGLTVLLGSSSQLPGSRRRAGGVKLERPQPQGGKDERAWGRRAAADHGRRGRSVFVLVLRVESVPGLAGGVVSQAPIRRRQHAGGCPDHVSGDRAARSDDRARPVAGSCRESELARGLVTLPVWGCAAVAMLASGVTGPGAWPAASRCHARVSSLREIAMVAIFFPRFSRSSGRWRRIQGTAWRSAPPGS
jgi:hypothetical protein